MANYFVGDVQGCFTELQRLLETVDFSASRDTLWAVGDLVARGPDSLETLRFFHSLGESGKVVLGNHDLHLLALAAGVKKSNPKDLLDQLLQAADLPMLIDWLRKQPLMRHIPEHNIIVSHAGLPPHWDLANLIEQSNNVSSVLQADDYIEQLIAQMYHTKQAIWSDELSNFEQMRYCIDALTRMRFLHQDGSLNFSCKLAPEHCTDGDLLPWYQWPNPLQQTHTIVFGHWAALMGNVPSNKIKALDTGCVWGGDMTLWHLESDKKINQKRLK
ncbi:MAG: symmetrical bis(5'-nucleosyl)-tetraphosphatase [Parashewanella sp.]